MVEGKGRASISKNLWTLRRCQDGCTYPLVSCIMFVYIVRGQSGGASGLPGDDDVASATEGVRCLQEFEEHALSCSMELVCGILL